MRIEDLPPHLQAQARKQVNGGAATTAGAAKKSVRPRHETGRMNKTESAYALMLDARKQAGEIVIYRHESLRFRLADKCWYLPDFVLWMTSGRMEAHEVKGHMEGDAAVKLRVFREQYPEIKLVIVRCNRRGEWTYEER